MVLAIGSMEMRDMMLEAEPKLFYITDHYKKFPYLLARLSKLDKPTLKQLLGARAAADRSQNREEKNKTTPEKKKNLLNYNDCRYNLSGHAVVPRCSPSFCSGVVRPRLAGTAGCGVGAADPFSPDPGMARCRPARRERRRDGRAAAVRPPGSLETGRTDRGIFFPYLRRRLRVRRSFLSGTGVFGTFDRSGVPGGGSHAGFRLAFRLSLPAGASIGREKILQIAYSSLFYQALYFCLLMGVMDNKREMSEMFWLIFVAGTLHQRGRPVVSGAGALSSLGRRSHPRFHRGDGIHQERRRISLSRWRT